MRVRAVPLLLAVLAASGTGLPPVPAGEPEPDRATEAPPPDAEAGEQDPPLRSDRVERVVVSATAVSVDPLDAPAAVDVLSGEAIASRPGDTLVDQLRRVPGLNVVQFSARDTNLASRSASGGINNSTLALADGRTLYQDFLGFVMWEFAPSDPDLVERVEVVRGPASSLWGANAVGGLVHVVTKSPRDTLGGKLEVQAGDYGTRSLRASQSFLAGDWALRASGGWFEMDPFERPATILNFFGEEIDPDLGVNEEGARDSGTRQPRFELRADRDLPDGGRWMLQGGWAQTRGRIATGIGPFDVDPATAMSYLQARYVNGPHEAQVYVNHFDGNGVNLINGIRFGFTSLSTHLTARSRVLLGPRGVIGWGVEGRLSEYDLSIAPAGERRSQLAGYAEGDLTLAPRWRLVLGARADYVRETIGTTLSPRAGLLYKPRPNQTWRLAAGQAFRSPSVIESDLLVPRLPVAILDWAEVDEDLANMDPPLPPIFSTIAELVCSERPDNCGAPPGEIPVYIAVTAARGSRELDEERTRSLELGYAGRFGPWGVSATLYGTRSRGGIDFPQLASYGVGPDGRPGTGDDVILPSDPDGDGIHEAPAVDVCDIVDALRPFDELCRNGEVTYNRFLSIMLDGLIPALFGYRNRGEAENRGVEVGLDWSHPWGVQVWLNASWQDDAESDGIEMPRRIATVLAEREADQDLDGDGRVADTAAFVNNPPGERISAGVSVDRGAVFASLGVDRVTRAFWQDVLTSDFWGYTGGYTLVGLQGGWRSPSRRLEITARVTNLLDERIQQHIFGDIIGRRATVGLRWRWDDGSNRRP